MIRAAAGDADLELCVRVLAAVDGVELSIDQLRPVQGRLLVHDSGRGYAFVNDSSVAGSAYAMVRVLPSARGHGVGSELATAAVDAARGAGKESAWGVVGPDDLASLGFAEARGFSEVGRDVKLTRRLSPGDGCVRAGVCELEEEHRPGAYAVAVAAIPDMVTAGQAEARPYEEWVKQELDDAAAAFGALVKGRVVGYATLQPLGDDPTRLEHGFTGVLPDNRRRGIATALGDAQIEWAADRGYEELFTTTGVTNTGLRRQKAKLGYVEEAGPILVRGPVSALSLLRAGRLSTRRRMPSGFATSPVPAPSFSGAPACLPFARGRTRMSTTASCSSARTRTSKGSPTGSTSRRRSSARGSKAPDELRERLAALGVREETTGVTTGAVLSDLPPLTPPPGVSIEEDDEPRPLPIRHWVARQDERGVGNASAFFTSSTVLLEHVEVAEEERRRAIGTALALVRLHEGRRLGCGLAVFGTTPESAALYEQFGFTTQPDEGRCWFYLPAP